MSDALVNLARNSTARAVVRTLGLPRALAGRGVASLLAVFVILGFALRSSWAASVVPIRVKSCS